MGSKSREAGLRLIILDGDVGRLGKERDLICICPDRFFRRPNYLPPRKLAVEYTSLADIVAAPGD